MGDTGSERSKPPSLPPRCPCGFWGSSKTRNLCSKCFANIQKKQPDEDCAPGPSSSSGSSHSSAFSKDISSSSISSHSLPSDPIKLEQMTAEDKGTVLMPVQEKASSTDTGSGTLLSASKRPHDSDTGPEEEATAAKRARPSEEGASHGGQKQRSRRRCHCCQSKLELVQQELGLCRCGNVFCMLHRLPEQHDCRFDHLGRGRQEAVLKMVKLDRKVGRSCQRIGEECS
ncbi:AN1-type zinc finger protein 3-like [Brienomyrus brachyistius]|uniref:AN1-type zinc finger protein 3-like n=1 Tax=Brienomyrus brachyistius TaxID=42636 RepID=UPI0020B44F71|nr:AN1-type zinc finger protein 3-like [Brienomyrus brachyistius]